MFRKGMAKLSIECNVFYSGSPNTKYAYYTKDPDLHIADWLLRQNSAENKDEEISGMKLSTDAITITTDIPKCMSIQNIQ